MPAKSYKSKVVELLIERLKAFWGTVMMKYFKARGHYNRLNQRNGKLHRENERLEMSNQRLQEENKVLREENKDYKLLRKAFVNKQIDGILEQARAVQQSNRREKKFRFER
jgi:hypothetical protein